MSKQKCLLIAYALVLLIVMTMPIPAPAPKCRGDSRYPHDFYSTDGCKTLICKDCGTRKSQEYVDHVFEQIDCYQRQCTRCGLVDDRLEILCLFAGLVELFLCYGGGEELIHIDKRELRKTRGQFLSEGAHLFAGSTLRAIETEG